MISMAKPLVKGITLLFWASLLSSCANDSNFGSIPDFSSRDSEEYSHSETDDTRLENVESKVCLDQELNTLDQTGPWDEHVSPNSAVLTDSVVYDFPVVLNNKVNAYLEIFQNQQREQFGRWLAKSAIYRPMVEKELGDAGLPMDLLYLAMIESGYNQMACSSAKAVGLWQFMQPTGRQYGLQVDKYVDERRDPEKSTRAAAAYLADLYQEFNDWHLAVAAYNGGPGTIRNGLKKHNVDNFWDLAGKEYLSLETKRYVPKLIAALLIAKNPEKYGFTDIAYHKPLRYETLTVRPGMSLEAIALISNSTAKEIQKLNQELRLGKTPLNTAQYEVKIPEATRDIAKKNLSRLHSIVTTDYKTHKVRKGDTLTKISKKYNVNKTTILKVNDLHSGKLANGRHLRIPYNTITYQLLPEGSAGAQAVYRDSLVLHLIKKGDTVSKIARHYNVPPNMIVVWNGLQDTHSIRAGQQLALYIDRGDKKKSARSVAAIAARNPIKMITSNNDPKIVTRIEKDAPFQWYNVKTGDSLWTISRKFSASTADIKKWNNLKSDRIQPGSKLKLKKV